MLFFLLVVFAAWTSSISLPEPRRTKIELPACAARRRLGYGGRGMAAGRRGMSVIQRMSVLQIRSGLFDQLDKLTTNIMMPAGGLLVAVFAGWVMHREHAEEEAGMSPLGFRTLRFVLRYISPVAIVLIFLHVAGLLG